MAIEQDSISEGDRHFAANMKRLREQRGWSQSDFANRLRAAGLSYFHQTTISRIESGERTVRIGESFVISRVLDAEHSSMLQPVDVAVWKQRVRQSTGELLRTGDEVREATSRHIVAQAEGFLVLEMAESAQLPTSAELLDMLDELEDLASTGADRIAAGVIGKELPDQTIVKVAPEEAERLRLGKRWADSAAAED